MTDPDEEPVTGSLAQIVMIPASANLSPGLTQQFYAYGRLNAGDSVAVGVTFSATGGTITGDGLYTAGGTPGTYAVVARHTDGTLSDTSGVIITGGGSPGGNIYSWGFESPGPPRNDRFGWFTSFASDQNAPDNFDLIQDPAGAARGDWYVRSYNQRTNSAWGQMMLSLDDVGAPTYQELYVRFAVQIAGGFAREGFKTLRFFDPVSGSIGYVTIEAPSQSVPEGGNVRIVYDNSGVGGIGSQGAARSLVRPNQWHWIECQFNTNPGGHAFTKIWVDGQLVIDFVHPNTNTGNVVISRIAIPQSGPDQGSDVDMWAQFDEIAVSTEWIGIP